ncbi:hypothetical protein BB560_005452, partial [Smittium megazygosporum]
MAKKKGKAFSNLRGYATTSTQSKAVREAPEILKEKVTEPDSTTNPKIKEKEESPAKVDVSTDNKQPDSKITTNSFASNELQKSNITNETLLIESGQGNPLIASILSVKKSAGLEVARRLEKESLYTKPKPSFVISGLSLTNTSFERVNKLYLTNSSNNKIKKQKVKLSSPNFKEFLKKSYSNYTLLKLWGLSDKEIIEYISLNMDLSTSSKFFVQSSSNLLDTSPVNLTELSEPERERFLQKESKNDKVQEKKILKIESNSNEQGNTDSLSSKELVLLQDAVDNYIQYISNWYPSSSDINDVWKMAILNLSTKNKKKNKQSVDPLERYTIDEEDPSLLDGIHSFKFYMYKFLLSWLQPKNSKDCFSSQLKKTKLSMFEISKKLKGFEADFLFDPFRAKKFLDAFIKLYNSKEIAPYTLMLNAHHIYQNKLLESSDTSTHGESETNDEDTVQSPSSDGDKPLKDSCESNSLHSEEQDNPNSLLGELFETDSSPSAENTSTDSSPNCMNFNEPTSVFNSTKKLLNELIQIHSKNFELLTQSEPNYTGPGYRSILLVSWEKKKDSFKIISLISKSEFSSLFKTISNQSLLLVKKQNFEFQIVLSMPEIIHGKTLNDAFLYVLAMCIYSISPWRLTLSRLPLSLENLTNQWKAEKDKNDLFTLEDTVKSESQFFSEFVDVDDPKLENEKFESLEDKSEAEKATNQTDTIQNSKVPETIKTPEEESSIDDLTKSSKSALDSVYRGIKKRLRWKWSDVEERRSKSKSYLSKIKPVKDDLPATKKIADISSFFETDLKDNRVFIIEGDTGCGKSTQIPQILLEILLKSDKYDGGKIMCTQPRRVSAVSIAERVSEELADPPKPGVGGHSSLVGSHIRLRPNVSDSNVIVFCTTGVLIQQMTNNPDLLGVSVVVIDEVQERSMETDFLLAVLKKLVSKREDIRLVLMSATIDTNSLSNYFEGCPIISIPGRMFPVSSYFLDELVQQSGYTLDEDSEFSKRNFYSSSKFYSFGGKREGKYGAKVEINYHLLTKTETKFSKLDIVDEEDFKNAASSKNETDDYSQVSEIPTTSDPVSVEQILERMNTDIVNTELIYVLLKKLIFTRFSNSNSTSTIFDEMPQDGAILVFLPGIKDINKVESLIEDDPDLGFAIVIKLHSAIYASTNSSNSSKKIYDPFLPAPEGKRKIVLATNIAETGITIPDVTVVIDSGRSKRIKFDTINQITVMEEGFISQASAKQRMGRAGRVQPGVCLRLFKEKDLQQWPEFDKPEITRLSLHNLCLRLKNLFPELNMFSFFESFLTPPPKKSVETAIFALVGSSSLKPIVPKIKVDDETDSVELKLNLTSLGKLISKLPLDLHLAKMLLYGILLRCLDPILTITAALSQSKSVFVQSENEEIKRLQSVYSFGVNLNHPSFPIESGTVKASKFKFFSLENITDRSLHRSDFVALIKAYREWRFISSVPRTTRIQIISFCRKRGLNLDVLENIEDTKDQYFRLLSDLKLLKSSKNRLENIRPYKPLVYGFKSGHVVYSSDIYENRYSDNIAAFSAALISGLDNVLVPKVSDTSVKKSHLGPKVEYLSPIPSTTKLGSIIIAKARKSLSNKLILAGFDSDKVITESNDFSDDTNYTGKQQVRIHSSSVNSVMFKSLSPKSALPPEASNIFIKEQKAFNSVNSFMSQGLLVFSQFIRQFSHSAVFAMNTSVIPLSFALVLLPYTTVFESITNRISLIENSRFFVKSAEIKQIALLRFLNECVSSFWNKFHTNFKTNPDEASIKEETGCSDDEFIDLLVYVLSNEFSQVI